MNRKERRAAQKNRTGYQKLSVEARKQALVKNGITTEDLAANFKNGYQAGSRDMAGQSLKMIYAAVCLALHQEFGFGADRCRRTLQTTDDIVINTLASEEAIDEVFQKLGLEIAINDPFDRVKEVSP